MAKPKSSPLHILMTADTVGGVWTYAMELCNALEGQVQFSLVTMGAPLTTAQREEVGRSKNINLFETTNKLEWMEHPWEEVDDAGSYLIELEQRLKPDIVHLNAYAFAALPFTAPVVLVAHSDVYTWWRAVKGSNPPREWKEYYDRVQRGINNTDVLIAPSRSMLEALTEVYTVPADARIVYNARNLMKYPDDGEKNNILSAGRIWDEAKNVQLLVRSAVDIPYKIRMAGETSFEGSFFDQHLSNIELLGKLDSRQMASEFAAAAVYVLPAKYEPFGLSVLEAAISGCALVLGDIPSLREIWGDAAVYVDADDSGALADLINRLMEDGSERSEYASKAMTRAMLYSTTLMAESYLEIYRELITERSTFERKEILHK